MRCPHALGPPDRRLQPGGAALRAQGRCGAPPFIRWLTGVEPREKHCPAEGKYLTQDWLWYFPPVEMTGRLVAFANEHGDPAGRPCCSIDGQRPVTATQWARLRHPWRREHGLTNVWPHPPLNGAERYRGDGRRVAPRVHSPGWNATAHLNQKPLELMRRIVKAAANEGDTIREPFGGLCSASVAAVEAGRIAFAAEPDPYFSSLAKQRLAGEVASDQLPLRM